MPRAVRRVIAVSAAGVVGLAFAVATSPVHAIKPFYAELRAKYVQPESKEPRDVTLLIAVEQAGCTICHPGEDTRKFTRFGGQLALRISKFDKGDKPKIRAALDEVAALRSDPHDAKSPTFGELFQQGKLPPPTTR